MKHIFSLILSLSSMAAMGQNSINSIPDVIVCIGPGAATTKAISWTTNITAVSSDYTWSISGLPPCLSLSGNAGGPYTGNTSSPTDSHNETLTVDNTPPPPRQCGDYPCTLTVTRGTESSVIKDFMIRVYYNYFNHVVQQSNTNGTQGCRKTFRVVNQDCINAQSPFPPGCGTKYYYLIYRSNTAPTTYPTLPVILLRPFFPLVAGTCPSTMSNNIWYRLRNDGYNDLSNFNATMPDNLPFNTSSTQSYYVICYVDNTSAGCCAPSTQPGYALCPPFQITQPTIEANVYVCSKSPYPPGTYNQCCLKMFELNSNSNGTGTSINNPNYIYWWIIQSYIPTTNNPAPDNPSCLLAVTAQYYPLETAVCSSMPALPQNTWHLWGTRLSSQMAPKLPPLSGNSRYYVSCYIQRQCNTLLPPFSKFAVQQVFQVLAPLAPVAPVITVNAPCSFITYSGRNRTIKKCRLSPGNITLSVSPSLQNTTYTWYKTDISGVETSSTGSSITFPNNVLINFHDLYVTATTIGGYMTPGCRVSSVEKMHVIIQNCPACPGVVSGSWTQGPGTYSFIVGAFGTPFGNYSPNLIGCPGTIIKVKMEVWGAGGYGKPGTNGSEGMGGEGGCGGGGGGYAMKEVTVTVPTCGVLIYWVEVGAGGNWSVPNGGTTQVKNTNSTGIPFGPPILYATGGTGGSATNGVGGIGSINSWAGAPGFSSSPPGSCDGTAGGLGGAGGGPGSIGNNGGAGGHGGYSNCLLCDPSCTAHDNGWPDLFPGIDGGNGRVVFSW